MHFFERFSFCPGCGEHYQSSDFDQSEHVFHCNHCSYEFYQNSTPAVTALIPQADNPENILMITRSTPPGEGRYDLPGGILRYGELPLEGVVREVREETLLEIEPLEILHTSIIDYHYQGGRILILESCFLSAPVADDVTATQTSEASQVHYFPAARLLEQPDLMAFPEHREIISKYLKKLHRSQSL